MFSSGQIINKNQHVEFANWNNVNGGKLRSVLLSDGTYRLEEITQNLVQEKRAERDYLLTQTDKYMITDFPITDEEKDKYKSYRQYLRDITQDPNFPNLDIKTFQQYVD